jgi:hypothetical protein
VPCHELAYPYDFAILEDVCQLVAALLTDPGSAAPAAPVCDTAP